MAHTIHGNIEPANVMFVKGNLCLIDFGTSFLLSSTESSTIVKHDCINLDYAAREVVVNYEATQSSDVYSLGCILFEIVCGKHVLSHCDDKSSWVAKGFPLNVPNDLPEIFKRPLQRYRHSLS